MGDSRIVSPASLLEPTPAGVAVGGDTIDETGEAAGGLAFGFGGAECGRGVWVSASGGCCLPPLAATLLLAAA